MSRPRSLNRSWLFLCIALILRSPNLDAAEPQPCGQDPQCGSHRDRGVEFDRAGRYGPALREFQAAYKQQKDPRVALNIGRTLHKLGRFAEAISVYKDVGRRAPADTELQKKLLEFTAQAKQNLPVPPAAPTRVTVVNNLPPAMTQTAPVNLAATAAATATATNTNIIKIDLGTLFSGTQPVQKTLYKRASLWVPLVGLALAASAAGVAAAAWPHPWQPDPMIPASSYSVATAGGAK